MKLKKIKIDWDGLGFNLVKTKSMFTADCQSGENWENGSLIPSGNIELSPAAVILNYGQGVFEGTKAFKTKNGEVALFRIDKNASRIAWSTERLCMPIMDQDFFVDAVIKTVKEFIDSLGINHEDFSEDLLNEKIYKNFKNIISES